MKVVWSSRAIRHLVALRAYIARDSEKHAALLVTRILDSVELLESHPHMGRAGRAKGTRELPIPDTPYVIPYRLKGERLELIAVFHGRQKWPLRG